jgi:hypothetical protein
MLRAIVERDKRGSFADFSLAPGALARVSGLLVAPLAANWRWPRRPRPRSQIDNDAFTTA